MYIKGKRGVNPIGTIKKKKKSQCIAVVRKCDQGS